MGIVKKEAATVKPAPLLINYPRNLEVIPVETGFRLEQSSRGRERLYLVPAPGIDDGNDVGGGFDLIRVEFLELLHVVQTAVQLRPQFRLFTG